MTFLNMAHPGRFGLIALIHGRGAALREIPRIEPIGGLLATGPIGKAVERREATQLQLPSELTGRIEISRSDCGDCIR